MRSFKLTNSSGVEYNLTEEKSFLFDIGGLGFSEATDYRRINNHYKPLEKQYTQWEPSGTIFFGGTLEESYAQFHDFVLFCQDAPLILSYFQHQTTYYMQVVVSSLDKSEATKRNGLECKVKFTGLSPWYEVLHADKRPVVIEEEKKYNYDYEVSVERPNGGYIYGGENGISVSLRCNSRLQSPLKICIHGPAVNPSWSLTCDGKIIGTGRVLITLDSEHMLIVDNTSPDFLIQQATLTGDLATDVYQLSDFNTDRFVYLGHGLNTLTVAHEGTNQVEVEVTAHVEYEAV